MYIKKYWYNYIGGTDDSLTLVDYLYDKGKTEICNYVMVLVEI